MFRIHLLSLLTAALCLCTAALPAEAAETCCDSAYCFSPEDFSREAELKGICITGLPNPNIGTLMLDARVIRPGDILTADQLAKLTFCPLRTQTDRTARVDYLPVCETAVLPPSSLSISVLGKEDKAPIAEDLAAETYKNLPITGKLKVSDPENQSLTFTVLRQPRRGSIAISEDSSFTYTPKKNKIGVDSFTFTAADPAGNVSREATVTVTILKPSDALQYTDTLGTECSFAAEWMRHTGIFTGETLAGNPCFLPEKPVTRGEFTAMLTKALELTPEDTSLPTGYTDEIPRWLQPYLAAAVRSGLTAGLPQQEVFGADVPISGAEAAVMVQNALDLTAAQETAAPEESTLPVWAAASVSALQEHGFSLDAGSTLTRGDAAQILYRAAKLYNSPSPVR